MPQYIVKSHVRQYFESQVTDLTRYVVHGLFRANVHDCEDLNLLGLPSLDPEDLQEPGLSSDEVLDGRRTSLYISLRYMQSLATAGLYHLWERQVKQVLLNEITVPSSYYRKNLKHKNPSDRWRSDVHKATFEDIADLFDHSQIDIRQFNSYGDIKTLSLITNTIKHGGGRSCDELLSIRRDLFWPRPDDWVANLFLEEDGATNKRTPDAQDLDIREHDYCALAQSVQEFWREF